MYVTELIMCNDEGTIVEFSDRITRPRQIKIDL